MIMYFKYKKRKYLKYFRIHMKNILNNTANTCDNLIMALCCLHNIGVMLRYACLGVNVKTF